MKSITLFLSLSLLILSLSQASTYNPKGHYYKQEVYIPMRDGVRLYTAIYTPKDTSKTYPIMMVKTPYGIKPYGTYTFPEKIGPSEYMAREGYIFVYQDARGRFMSEGTYVEMVPHIDNKKDTTQIDNSSDTYDAVEWLIKNLKYNNGKVGLWGISYRGFYAASGIIDAHPAIKCSSPQAPIADWFVGDDVHHNGAFALITSFNFMATAGQPHKPGSKEWPTADEYQVRDAYNFFLELGTLSNVNEKYFGGKSIYWDSLYLHPNYDDFWQKRNILPHLKNIKTAVLVTGGWFDHENLYGSLKIYEAINKNSNNHCMFALGPWIHGGWARTTGEGLGLIEFGSSTSDFYQKEIELPFFNYYLKGKGDITTLEKIYAFETGSNQWHTFDEWPPAKTVNKILYLHADNQLSELLPVEKGLVSDSYISDPEHPVPYTNVYHHTNLFYNKEYMIEDQRFAASRPDVLTFQTEKLPDTLTIAGPIKVKLFASVSGSDADFIVKVIDVYPDSTRRRVKGKVMPSMPGLQQLVRAEIMRAKYRNSLEFPEPLISDMVTEISIDLNDVYHSLLPGHKLMIQIQSSWFPLYNRNTHKFMNIYEAKEDDYKKAEIHILHSEDYPSQVILPVL